MVRQAANGMMIERRTALSREDFLTNYRDQNRPVIIVGAMAGWPALGLWNPDYLDQICGHETIKVQTERNLDPDCDVYACRTETSMRFGEYVAKVKSAGQTNDIYLIAGNAFLYVPSAQHLLDDIAATSPDYLEGKPQEHHLSFWFGPGGTVTKLHFDRQDVMLAQIYGSKRITMIPPSETSRLYHERSVFSEIDVEKPDFIRHPLFRGVDKIVFDLHPGEVAFLPIGWWHHVKALNISISLSLLNFPPYGDLTHIPTLPPCP